MPTSLLEPDRWAPIIIHLTDQFLRAGDLSRRLVPLAIEAGVTALHVNLAAVEVPTAGGLGELVALAGELRPAGVKLVLRHVQGLAYEVFQVTGLTAVLDVRPA